MVGRVRKILLAVALIFAIWLIGDSSFNVFSALRQHEPSYRIFRALLEVNLMFFCAAVSLSLWTQSIGTGAVRSLFFQPPLGEENTSGHTASNNPQSLEEDQCDDLGDDEAALQGTRGGLGGDEALFQEEKALDADYAEDGEVQPPINTSDSVVTPLEVTNVALDMFLAILVTLFLFTLSSSREEYKGDAANAFWSMFSSVAAPTFPLILFVFFIYRAFFPWSKSRRPFWTVVSYTWGAPWFPISFRDGFIGDVITSSVRPLKDISFTLFYIMFGLKGWWSTHEYRHFNFLDTADASVPEMERSWIVHTVVLPVCSASPLWWRFLQNLRQVFDERQRWPYLGNAFKYFLAAQVAMFGVFHPDKKDNIVWLASFVIATLYQCWWDVYMDWNLIDRKGSLRSKRLYQSTSFYWAIAWINIVLRFCWTLSFVPLHYLNASGVLTENLVGNWATHILGPVIGSAEIIRRMLWGLLRFEWEAVKTNASEDENVENIYLEDDDSNPGSGSVELQPMLIRASGESAGVKIQSPPSQKKDSPLLCVSDMSSMNAVQVIGELVLYATTFCCFCFIMAAHRGTY